MIEQQAIQDDFNENMVEIKGCQSCYPRNCRYVQASYSTSSHVSTLLIFHFFRKIKENCPTYTLINNSLIIDSTDTNLELAKSLTRTNRTKGTKKNIYITYHLNLQKLLISAPIITSSIVMIIKSYLMTFCGVRFLGPRAGQHMQNSMAY